MKKIILSIAFFTLLVSCSKSTEEQAKLNISKYLKANMDDASSYEPLEFGKLDTLYTSFEDSKEGIELKEKEYQLSYRSDELSDKLDSNNLTIKDIDVIKKENDDIYKKRLKINDAIQNKIFTYKGIIRGYSMTHKFRGKNKLGAKILNTIRFSFDKKLNITDTE